MAAFFYYLCRMAHLIFTNCFPFEPGETFLATELPYHLRAGASVVLVPLYGKGAQRGVSGPPDKLKVLGPLLPFSLSNRRQLLFHGLCNTAPLGFVFHDFFADGIWKNPTRIWKFMTSALLIRALLSQRNFWDGLLRGFGEQDVLYFYWGDKTALLLPFLRRRWARLFPERPFPKSIVRFHGSDLYESAKGYLPFRKRLFPAIDLACPISEHGANYLRETYGSLTPPLQMSHLGTPDFGLGPEPQDGVFHIVSCSGLIPLKRPQLILEALEILQLQGFSIPFRWTHIGDGPLRSSLEARLKTKPPSSLLSVQFLGQLPHDAVMDFYRQHPVNLQVLTSRSEGVPVSLMEALSFGIPVLATDVGGVSELVKEDWGMLLPAALTAQELANALAQFLYLSTEEARNLRLAARKTWAQHWSAEQNFSGFCSSLNPSPV